MLNGWDIPLFSLIADILGFLDILQRTLEAMKQMGFLYKNLYSCEKKKDISLKILLQYAIVKIKKKNK